MLPTTSGTPTSANSKKPKRSAPESAAASDTRMLTGDPVSTRSDPACAAKASGMSSLEVGRPIRAAITTIIGSSAAIAPFGVITADSAAHRTSTKTTSRVGCPRAARTSRWPAHVVTPLASSASLTTNSDAMNRTVGSPKPATASSSETTPAA